MTDPILGEGSAETVAHDQLFGTKTLTALFSKRTVFSVISPDSSSVPGRLHPESPIQEHIKIKKKYVRIE